MRPLKTETSGLPAGTPWEVYQDPDGIRRAAWIGAEGRCSARVDGKGTLASLTAAGPLYAAHLATLGCDPETLIPCGFCGEEIAACLTLCPECKRDPDADVPCDECEDQTGRPTGLWEYSNGEGLACHVETCRACRGELKVEPPYADGREAALKVARAAAGGAG